MSVLNPEKLITPEKLDCRGTASVTLRFSAAAGLEQDPMDLVLIMDRSYSMDLGKMGNAKRGAGALLNMVAEASSGDPAGDLGSGSRVGMVSFSSTATQDVQLTERRAPMRTAIASLRAGGETNHTAAFQAAEKILGPKGTNRQVAVMFTDGITTTGGDAKAVTDRLKAAGVEIFCIGLLDDPKLLNSWASAPVAEHVAYTTDEKKLEELFRRVAARTVQAGAEQVRIREILSPEFRIVSIQAPSFGTARLVGEQELEWTMDYAGASLAAETYSLTFEIAHIGAGGGVKHFNREVIYEDRAGMALTFPSPTVEVICPGLPIYPEPCPEPTEVSVPHCKDSAR